MTDTARILTEAAAAAQTTVRCQTHAEGAAAAASGGGR